MVTITEGKLLTNIKVGKDKRKPIHPPTIGKKKNGNI